MSNQGATDIISLSSDTHLKFQKGVDGSSPKATLDITNRSGDKNVAYKIRTTAPKLFVVKPIQGILAPGRTITVEI